MAKKPENKKKKAARRKKSRDKKALYMAFAVSGVALVSFMGLFYFVFLHQTRLPEVFDETVATIHKQLPDIIYEEPSLPKLDHDAEDPQPAAPSHKEISPPKEVKRKGGEKPRVAIIIDDMGYRKETGEALLGLDLNLTFAFLPFGPYTDPLVSLAESRRRGIILHLPMEPADARWDPGEGALLLSMSRKAIRDTLEKDLAAVYLATGINNHMGSRFTQNREAMTDLLTLIKQHDMFFLDSYTSQHSRGFQIAAELGVKTARRDIFLDNERDKNLITRQIKRLVQLAEKKGSAIGIGHPHTATYQALRDSARMLKSRVKMVQAAELVQ